MSKIENTNRKPQENPVYYYVAHVDESGEVTSLMLTEKEFEKAKVRANKNKEDLPKFSIAVQVTNKQEKENL